MKQIYTKPTMAVLLVRGGQQPLASSHTSGVSATMSGYAKDDDKDAGFSQE